jgi:hypothetical protein
MARALGRPEATRRPAGYRECVRMVRLWCGGAGSMGPVYAPGATSAIHSRYTWHEHPRWDRYL